MRPIVPAAALSVRGVAPLVAVVAAVALGVAPPAVAGWRAPVAGDVARGFDPGGPFEPGRHRGVDLAAPPGAVVRAPCTGAVAFAGPVATAGRVVTLRCGRWRVTHLPLATISVRAGATVRPGGLLGTVAAGHGGLHLGVRREGRRFGYVDPLRFLATRAAPPPIGPPPRRVGSPRTRRVEPPRTSPPRAVRSPPRARSPAPARALADANRALPDSNPGARAPFAPWPAWLGFALVLAGAGLRLRARRTGGRGRVVAAGTLTR